MIERGVRCLGHAVVVVSLIALFSIPAPACTQFQKFFGCKEAPISVVPGTPAPVVPFVPSFEAVDMVTYFTDGRTVTQHINDTYFADESTAQTMASKFGAARVELRETPVTPGGKTVYFGGPNAGQIASSRVLIFLPGSLIKDNHGDAFGTVKTKFEINAGVLADFYRRMPEKSFPAFSYIYGFPPQTQYFLSLPEQYVWRTIYSFAAEANSVEAAPAATVPATPDAHTVL